MKRGDGEALLLSIVLILALVAVVFTVANTDFSLVSATGAQTVATGTVQDYCRPETTEGWTPQGQPTTAQPNCACADKKISDCGNTPTGYALPKNIPQDGSVEVWIRACAPHSLGCEDSYYTKSCLKGIPLDCICASQKISDCGNTPSGYTLPKNIPKDGSVSIWADICNPKPPCEDSYTTRPCDNCGCGPCPADDIRGPFSQQFTTNYDVPLKPPVDPNPPAGGGGGGDPSCGDAGDDVDDVVGMHLVFSEIGTTSARTQAILTPDASREPTVFESTLTAFNDFFTQPYQPTRAFWEQKVVADAEQAAQELENAARTDAQRTLTNDIAFATISRNDALAANPSILDAIQNAITSIFTSTTGALIADPLGKAKPAKTAFGKVLPILTPVPSDENVVDDLYNERVTNANNKATRSIGAAASCGKSSIAAAKANAQQLANLEDVPVPDIPARTVDWDALDPQKEWRGEFIEIYNPSQKAISLRNYYITDGTYVSEQDKTIFQAQANAYEAWRAQKDKKDVQAAEASFNSRAPTNAATTLAASVTTTRTPSGVFTTITGTAPTTVTPSKSPTPIITPNQNGLPNINPSQLTGNYYWMITTDPSRSGGGTWGDFHAQFHPDAVIGPGETQIIALSATGFKEVYGFLPTYEIINTNPAVMDVIPAFDGAIDYDIIGPLLSDVTTEGALTGETIKNPAGAGEMLAMYYWNGKSKLVEDIDYVVWGDERKSGVDKTGITIDGEQYLWDAPIQFDDGARNAPINLDKTRTFAELTAQQPTALGTTGVGTATTRSVTFGPARLTTEATPTELINARIADANLIAATSTLRVTDTISDRLNGETLATALSNNRLPLNLLSPPVSDVPIETEACSASPNAASLSANIPENDFDAAAEHVAEGSIYQIPIPVPSSDGPTQLDLEEHPYLPGLFTVNEEQSFGTTHVNGQTAEEALSNACPSASALSITAAARTLNARPVAINTPDTPSISFPDLNSRPTTVLMPGGTPLLAYPDFAGGRALHDDAELTTIRANSLQTRLPPLLSSSATARRNAAVASLSTGTTSNTFTASLDAQTLAATADLENGILTYQRDPCQPENEPDEEKSTVKTKDLTPAAPAHLGSLDGGTDTGQLSGEATTTSAPAGTFNKLTQTPHYDATCEHNGIPITKEGGIVECHDEQSENLAVAFQRKPATPGTLGVCDISASGNNGILGPNAPAGGLLDSTGGSHGGGSRAGSYNGITLTNANNIQQNFLSSTGVFNGILNAFAAFAQGKGSNKDQLWKDFMKAQGNDLANQYNQLYDMMLTASDIAAMSDFAIQHSIDPDGDHIMRAAERLVRDPQEHWNDAEDAYDHAANWLDYTKNSLDRAKASGDKDDIARAQEKYDAALQDASAKRQAADSARALYEKLANPAARVDSAQQSYNNADAAAKEALQKYSQLPDGSPEQQAAYAEYLQLKAQKEAAQKELDAAKAQLANDPTGALAKQEYLEQQAAYAALVKSYGLDVGGAITSSQLADFFDKQALLAGFGGPIDGLDQQDFQALAAQARGQGFNAALHSYLMNKVDQFANNVNNAIDAAQQNVDRLQQALNDARGTDKEKEAQDKLDKAKEELKQAKDYAAAAQDLRDQMNNLNPDDPNYEAKLEELLHALMKALAHAQAAAGLHGTVTVTWDYVPVFVVVQSTVECTGTGEGCAQNKICTHNKFDHYDITQAIVDDMDGDGIPNDQDDDPDGDGKFDTDGDGQEDALDTDGDGTPDTPMNAADQAANDEGNANQDPGGPGGAAAAAARAGGGTEVQPEPPTVPSLPFPIDVPAARSEQREWEAVRAMTEALPAETGAVSTDASAAATDKALDNAKNAQADARDAKIKALKDLLAHIKELKKEEIENLKKLLRDLGIEYKEGKILLPDGTIIDDQGRLLESRFPEGKNIANAQQALNAKLAADNAAQQAAHQAFIDGLATHGITLQGEQWFFAGKPIQNPLETGGQLIGLDGMLYGMPTFDLPAGQVNLAGYINNYYAPAQFADANGKPVDANNVIWYDGKYIDSTTGKEVSMTNPGGELTRIGLGQARDFSDGMQQLYGSFHDANGKLVSPAEVKQVIIATDATTGQPIYGLVGPDGTPVTTDNKGLYANLGIDFSGFDEKGNAILTVNGNPAFVDKNGNVVVQAPVYDAYGNIVGTKLTNLDGHDVVYGKDGTLYHDVGKQINLQGSEQEIADQLKAYGIGYEFSGFYKDDIHVDVQFVKGLTPDADSVNIVDSATGEILLTTKDAGILGVFHNLQGYELQEARTTVELYQAITGVNKLRVDQLGNLGLTTAEQAELAAAITTATMHDVQQAMNNGNYEDALAIYDASGLPKDNPTYKTLSIITQARAALANAGDSIESKEDALSTIGNLAASAGLSGLEELQSYLTALGDSLATGIEIQLRAQQAIADSKTKLNEAQGALEAINDELHDLKLKQELGRTTDDNGAPIADAIAALEQEKAKYDAQAAFSSLLISTVGKSPAEITAILQQAAQAAITAHDTASGLTTDNENTFDIFEGSVDALEQLRRDNARSAFETSMRAIASVAAAAGDLDTLAYLTQTLQSSIARSLDLRSNLNQELTTDDNYAAWVDGELRSSGTLLIEIAYEQARAEGKTPNEAILASRSAYLDVIKEQRGVIAELSSNEFASLFSQSDMFYNLLAGGGSAAQANFQEDGMNALAQGVLAGLQSAKNIYIKDALQTASTLSGDEYNAFMTDLFSQSIQIDMDIGRYESQQLVDYFNRAGIGTAADIAAKNLWDSLGFDVETTEEGIQAYSDYLGQRFENYDALMHLQDANYDFNQLSIQDKRILGTSFETALRGTTLDTSTFFDGTFAMTATGQTIGGLASIEGVLSFVVSGPLASSVLGASGNLLARVIGEEAVSTLTSPVSTVAGFFFNKVAGGAGRVIGGLFERGVLKILTPFSSTLGKEASIIVGKQVQFLAGEYVVEELAYSGVIGDMLGKIHPGLSNVADILELAEGRGVIAFRTSGVKLGASSQAYLMTAQGAGIIYTFKDSAAIALAATQMKLSDGQIQPDGSIIYTTPGGTFVLAVENSITAQAYAGMQMPEPIAIVSADGPAIYQQLGASTSLEAALAYAQSLPDVVNAEISNGQVIAQRSITIHGTTTLTNFIMGYASMDKFKLSSSDTIRESFQTSTAQIIQTALKPALPSVRVHHAANLITSDGVMGEYTATGNINTIQTALETAGYKVDRYVDMLVVHTDEETFVINTGTRIIDSNTHIGPIDVQLAHQTLITATTTYVTETGLEFQQHETTDLSALRSYAIQFNENIRKASSAEEQLTLQAIQGAAVTNPFGVPLNAIIVTTPLFINDAGQNVDFNRVDLTTSTDTRNGQALTRTGYAIDVYTNNNVQVGAFGGDITTEVTETPLETTTEETLETLVNEQGQEIANEYLETGVHSIICHSPCTVPKDLLAKIAALEREGKLTPTAKAALTAIAENPDFVNKLKEQLKTQQKSAYLDNELAKYGLTEPEDFDVLESIFDDAPDLSLEDIVIEGVQVRKADIDSFQDLADHLYRVENTPAGVVVSGLHPEIILNIVKRKLTPDRVEAAIAASSNAQIDAVRKRHNYLQRVKDTIRPEQLQIANTAFVIEPGKIDFYYTIVGETGETIMEVHRTYTRGGGVQLALLKLPAAFQGFGMGGAIYNAEQQLNRRIEGMDKTVMSQFANPITARFGVEHYFTHLWFQKAGEKEALLNRILFPAIFEKKLGKIPKALGAINTYAEGRIDYDTEEGMAYVVELAALGPGTAAGAYERGHYNAMDVLLSAAVARFDQPQTEMLIRIMLAKGYLPHHIAAARNDIQALINDVKNDPDAGVQRELVLLQDFLNGLDAALTKHPLPATEEDASSEGVPVEILSRGATVAETGT